MASGPGEGRLLATCCCFCACGVVCDCVTHPIGNKNKPDNSATATLALDAHFTIARANNAFCQSNQACFAFESAI